MSKTVPVSRFKSECLSMLDAVARTGEEIVVTKRGRPLARVTPAAEPESLLGSVRFLTGDDELIRPLEDRWSAEQD